MRMIRLIVVGSLLAAGHQASAQLTVGPAPQNAILKPDALYYVRPPGVIMECGPLSPPPCPQPDPGWCSTGVMWKARPNGMCRTEDQPKW